ncbi:DUF58 domain-containing protein [Leadbettera azotonutricia]|uniref:DUF58 domain-containing protein n=1 Tax=Leadbettera azotonutricia (strain ATCC BAA-888 / DSM 13862 / ZAS-9) TaxID=545695 RepID=F5Y9H4_LEAAZ|nr:DUF58 domain-containing protein [Leadbettera azotonutricia]AEF80252.1 putative protein of unknown function DUF58 [Leadbettera azotonutricia ZAS-9]
MTEEKGRWASIKTGGSGFLIAGIPLLLLLYIFTPQRLIQFAALFLLVIVLGSRIYSEYLIRSICLFRRDGELRGFRHEWIEAELSVENRGRLPAFMLAVGDNPGRLAVFRDNKILCTLGARRRRIFRWQGYGSSRGEFSLGPAIVRGADPLGLFPFTLISAETTHLFVYPAPGFLNLRPPGGIPLGALITANPFDEDLTRCRSLREYYPGDEMRRINWKASARMIAQSGGNGWGGLMVNEYESTLSYPLVVFLNADPAEYHLKTRELYLERAIEAAAAVCLMASRERQTLGFILHTKRGQFGEGVISPAAFTLIPILERLAVFAHRDLEENEKSIDDTELSVTLRGSTARMLDEGKFLPFGTRLVYAGSGLEESDYQALGSLRRYHLTLEYLCLDEKALPPPGERGFNQYQMKEAGYEIL